MEKHLRNIKLIKSAMVAVFFSCFFVGCNYKNVKVFVESGSPKENYLKGKKEIVFQQFFNDTIKVYTNNKLIFSEFVETDGKLQVAKKSCIVSNNNIPPSNILILDIGNQRYRLRIKDNYTFYYVNYLGSRATAVGTNDFRKFY